MRFAIIDAMRTQFETGQRKHTRIVAIDKSEPFLLQARKNLRSVLDKLPELRGKVEIGFLPEDTSRVTRDMLRDLGCGTVKTGFVSYHMNWVIDKHETAEILSQTIAPGGVLFSIEEDPQLIIPSKWMPTELMDDIHANIRPISPSELRRLFRQHGFKPIDRAVVNIEIDPPYAKERHSMIGRCYRRI